jgi:hypothetical protein
LAALRIIDAKHFLPEDDREIGEIVARQLASLGAERVPVARPSSATTQQLPVNKTFSHQATQPHGHRSPRNLEIRSDV